MRWDTYYNEGDIVPIDIENDSVDVALQKLKAKEDTLRKLEAISQLGSWEVDFKSGLSYWSDMSYKIYGIPKGTPTSIELFFSLLLPEYVSKAKALIAKGIKSGEVQIFQAKIKRHDAKIIDVLIHAQIAYDAQKNPLKIIGTTQDITKNIALQEHTSELSNLLEYSSSEIYIINKSTLNFVYVNRGACRALGYSKEDFMQMNIRDINPKLNENEIKQLQQVLELFDHGLNKTVHQRKDGSLYHVQSYLHNFKYKGEEVYVVFDTDITSSVELALQHEKQSRILENIHDAVIATDPQGKIISWNRGSRALLGYTKEEILEKSIHHLYDINNTLSLQDLFQIINKEEIASTEAYMLTKEKRRILCDISLSSSRDRDGKIDSYIGYIQDITQQKESQQRLKEQQDLLHYQANHDALTDLPNRILFKDRLKQTIATAYRHHKQFALLFIDLDQFKKINDTLGHSLGDIVLIEAAKRIKSVLRKEDTLSRLGGDEFTIIINDLDAINDASTVAQKIIDIMKEPMKISTHSLYVTSSIGISIYPDDALKDDNLIKYADVAMYKAKEEGRNNYQFYSADMTAYSFEKVVMESSLRVAINEHQFLVYYQPQVDALTEKIVGMEALVRWMHPQLGLVSPDKFITLAEENGLIIEIDRLVMEIAISQVAKWYKQGLTPGLLSLNLAMKQLNEEDFLGQLIATMKREDFHSNWLELEVTEGQVMHNPEVAIDRLKTLNSLGIEIAIDDFGTGYSSLSYLKKLPLDKLKIDQSFVRDIPDDEDDVAITKAILALGKSLNLTIVAEGVEKEVQKKFLVENGCDMIQGYFYSRPLPAEEMEKLLTTNGTWIH